MSTTTGGAQQSTADRLRAAPPEQRMDLIRALAPAERAAVLREIAADLPREQQRELAQAATRVASAWQPQNEDELWDFFRDECGIEIPRVAVCEGHCAPYDFARDVYFERGNPDKIAIGNRGSGKTNIMGAVHAANARTKPRYEGTTVGSVLSQSERCYAYFSEIAKKDTWQRFVSKLAMKETVFRNGSLIGIITGTITGVNSPHPRLAHFDEVELFRPGVYEEALNMAQSADGYGAMNVLTSSWKKARGFVSALIDDNERARRGGAPEPYQVYRWCLWETSQRCHADCSACPYASVEKGVWPDGSPRTFESVCKQNSPIPGTGKLKFSDGFVEVSDSVSRFRKVSRRMWESQQESKKPTMEGLVYDCFDEQEHTVEWWEPDPAYGDIDIGVDFGGTNPHAAGLWQTLSVAREHDGRIIPEGASICFDEVYAPNIGNVEFGRLVNQHIESWEAEYPGFRNAISGIYRDPAAKAAGLDWNRLPTFGGVDNPEFAPLRTRALGNIDRGASIGLCYEKIDGGLVYFDRMRCEYTLEEIGGWERSETTGEPVKEDDHTMDAMRYRFWNRHIVQRLRKSGRDVAPVTHSAVPRGDTRVAIGDSPWQTITSGAGIRDLGAARAQPRRRDWGLGS